MSRGPQVALTAPTRPADRRVIREMEMGKPLAVTGATLGYLRTEPVLRDVSVVARPGAILAVTGPSGAGKTTLLWAMAGLLPPAAGGIAVDGVELRDRDQAVAAGVVLIPQDNGLATVLTAAENIQVALIATGRSPAEARRLTGTALDRLGLAGHGDQLVEELSGGQQQRAAIARGLALAGDVLLADEVTSELDAQSRARVLELLRAEADRGATVVFATHDPEAAAVCDAEIHLADGVAVPVRGPAQPEPVRPEPAQPEPAQPEPVRPEPAGADRADGVDGADGADGVA